MRKELAMDINLDNVKGEDLTVDELRKCPGLENLNEEEATHIVKSLKELSILVCNAVDKMYVNKSYSIDNQCNIGIFAGTKAA